MTPERKKKLTAVLQKRQPDLTVVMENIHDPHNIAAVMRSCDAVGIQDIYIIKTKLPNRKKWGAHSSSSANKWLNIYTFEQTKDCFEAVRSRYDKIYTTRLQEDTKELYELDFTDSVALVFGNERNGVSKEACKFADGNFVIPQVGMISSLNISVACAVTLYEAYRQKSRAGHYDKPRLTENAMRNIRNNWKLYDD